MTWHDGARNIFTNIRARPDSCDSYFIIKVAYDKRKDLSVLIVFLVTNLSTISSTQLNVRDNIIINSQNKKNLSWAVHKEGEK